jgi:hypothetical protein
MALSPHDDKPRESWNDKSSMIQDLFDLTRRIRRTHETESPPNLTYRQQEKSVVGTHARDLQNTSRMQPKN